MKIRKLTFRLLNIRWVIIDRKKYIKDINKRTNANLSYDPVLGIFYIDHEMGISLRIVGNILKDKKGYWIDERFLNENICVIRCNKKINYDITILENKTISGINGTNEVIDQINVNYNKKAIIESRKLEEIDELRHEFFPDDVELLNYNDKGDEELIWGRIEDCSIENKVFVCTLLNDSNYNPKYTKGTLVMVKYEKVKKENILRITNSVKKIEK